MNGLLERLVTPLDPDALRELLGPLHTRRLQGVIESITPLTATAAEIVIRPGRTWSGHVPGQYLPVGVDIDGVRHTRCYSLTSEPRARGPISIAVQSKPDGFVSRHLVHAAQPGDVVQLGEPAGDFTLDPAGGGRTLIITGGSGITPAVGMVRALASSALEDSGDRADDVVVVHHAPTRAATMFADELDALAARHAWLRIVLVTTRDGGARLDEARLNQLCPDWPDRETYVCGPEPLLDFAASHWAHAGRGLHMERFVAPVRKATDSAGGNIRFAASNAEAPAEANRSILEVAESAGLLPASGCRMGICHSCSTRLDEGCTVDLRDGRRSEAGAHVQICVSAADGDVTLDL